MRKKFINEMSEVEKLFEVSDYDYDVLEKEINDIVDHHGDAIARDMNKIESKYKLYLDVKITVDVGTKTGKHLHSFSFGEY